MRKLRHRNVLYRPGDIIGTLGSNIGSQWINIATYGIPFWGLSHVAIAAEYEDRLVLFESTTWNDEPCIIQKKLIKGVQAHYIANRIASYDGSMWHYPLLNRLDRYESKKLTNFLLKQIGKSYDYIGAFRAGGEGFSWLESHLHDESLHTLFCSELCAAAHREVNRFATKNAARWNPNNFTRAERNRGTLGTPMRIK